MADSLSGFERTLRLHFVPSNLLSRNSLSSVLMENSYRLRTRLACSPPPTCFLRDQYETLAEILWPKGGTSNLAAVSPEGKELLEFLAQRLSGKGGKPFWTQDWFQLLLGVDGNSSLAEFYTRDSGNFEPWQHLLCGLKFWRNCLSHCQYEEIPYHVSLFPAALVPFAINGKIDRFLRSLPRPPPPPPRKPSAGNGGRGGADKGTGGRATAGISFGPVSFRAPPSLIWTSAAPRRPPSIVRVNEHPGQAAAQVPLGSCSRIPKRTISAKDFVYSQERGVGTAASAGFGRLLR